MNEFTQPDMHDDNIENLVISHCLKSAEALDLVTQRVTQSDFYRIENQVMFGAIERLHSEGRKVDGAVVGSQVQNDLRIKNCRFEDVFNGYSVKEWPLILEQLDNSTHQNLIGYIDELLNYSISRSLRKAGNDIYEAANSGLSPDEKLTQAARALGRVSDRIEPDEMPSMRSIVKQSLIEFNDALESDQSIRGIPTGYRQIDKALSGLINGEMYVLAAKSGAGKTTLGLNIAQNMAAHSKVKVFSLEMPSSQLVTRMACRAKRVPLEVAMNGTATGQQIGAYSDGLGDVTRLQMQIDDRAGVTIEQLKSRARLAKLKEGVDVIVVDYLQYLRCPGQDNRTMEITRISNGLKEIAKDLDIPVLVLSQLNRENEKRGNKRHVMSDLKESSAIEHDACAVLFIYIPSMYETVDEKSKNHVEIDIAKNRHGRTGKHWLIKDFEYGQFLDWGDMPYPASDAAVTSLADYKNKSKGSEVFS